MPPVISDKSLLAASDSCLGEYGELETMSDDPVLAHTDFGLHNMVFTADSLEPCGLIDFEAAAFVDRHYDFRYTILDFEDTTLFRAT